MTAPNSNSNRNRNRNRPGAQRSPLASRSCAVALGAVVCSTSRFVDFPETLLGPEEAVCYLRCEWAQVCSKRSTSRRPTRRLVDFIDPLALQAIRRNAPRKTRACERQAAPRLRRRAAPYEAGRRDGVTSSRLAGPAEVWTFSDAFSYPTAALLSKCIWFVSYLPTALLTRLHTYLLIYILNLYNFT